MEAPYCDVIGCTLPADRFYSDGFGPIERLCAQHWSELLKTARDRALRFESINPDKVMPESYEPELPPVRLPA